MGMDTVFRLSLLLNLVDDMTSQMTGVERNTTESMDRMNKAFGSMQKAGAIMTGMGAGILGVGAATVKSTFETQNALGELASLGVQDLKAVEDAAKRFSDAWAGTTKADFISASYDIKSGIASLTDEGVAQFAELAALTGKATKSTTQEMGSLFATGYGIYKGAYSDMSDLDFGGMFSAGIATAVKNYKTAGSEMASSISTLGATATNNMVPLEEQLAILGQLQTTMSGSEAATKYKAFLNTATSAGEKLGITFTDSNNQLLSTPAILEKLKGKYGETLDAVEKQQLKEAFGTDEAIAMIDLLYGNVDTLKGGMEDLQASMKNGVGVTEEMAKAIQNTPEQKFTVLKQQIHNNVEELAGGLLPAVNSAMDKVSGMVQKCGDWIGKNQEVAGTILKIVMGLGIFLVIVGGSIAIIGTLGKAFIAVKSSIGILKTALSGLNLAFLSSPVFWVIIGIVALVAAFVLLWNKCEAFRNFWTGVFAQVQSTFQAAWSAIKPALEQLKESFSNLVEACQPLIKIIGTVLGGVLMGAVSFVVGFVTGAANALEPLIKAFSSFVDFVTNIIHAIAALFKGDFSGALDFAGKAVDNLKDFFVNGFNAITEFIGGFASGFLDTIGGALKSVGKNVSGTISKMKEGVSTGMSAVKGFFTKGFTDAANSAKSKLKAIEKAVQENGGGMKGAAKAAMNGVKASFTSGFNAIDSLTGGKLSSIKNKFKQNMDGAKNAVSSALGAAKGIATQQLSGMVSAFKSHGGGIKGAAAAVMTGIKGVFNTGYTAINNLTGGKLDKIKDAFSSKLEGARSAVSGAIEKIKSIFNFKWSLPKLSLPEISVTGKFGLNPPSMPKFDIKWNATGGVMTKPTIFGAAGDTMLGGGEAGPEAILPLAVLWDKLRTIIGGLLQNGKEDDTDSLKQSGSILTKLTERTTEKRESTTSRKEKETAKGGNVNINQLHITVDIQDIKDLPLLYKLIDELKDAQNRTDTPEPEPA